MAVLRKILVILIVVTMTFVVSSQAFAIELLFDLFNHPHSALGINQNILDNDDYGLRLDTPGENHTFSFVQVQMLVDTATGEADVFGRVEHIQSRTGGVGTGDLFDIEAQLNLLGFHGTWNTQALPYDEMFDDLLANAAITLNESITYNNNTLNIVPVGLVDPVNGYMGPQDWIGKKLLNPNDELFISYRHRLDPNVYNSANWDVLVANGWWLPEGNVVFDETDDFLFIMRKNVIPEPATMALFGLGAPAIGFIRRRKKQ